MFESIDRRALDWVIAAVRPGTEVAGAKLLQGGVSSVMHAVTLRSGEERLEVVLRRITDRDWLREEPDVVRHEADSLRVAAALGVETPQLLAFDETGDACGAPAVAMTRLAGAVVLQPEDMEQWLGGLAEALARVHGAPQPAPGHRWRYRAYEEPAAQRTPAWSAVPEAWAAGIAAVQGPRPAFEPRFIHRDYHPANVLWQDGKVSGVVDWVNGCLGPVGADIGHCRINLALLHGIEAADRFLTLYRKHAAAAGTPLAYDPHWDIQSLLDMGEPDVYAGWTALGVTGLTDELMRQRTDAYMASLAQRLAAHARETERRLSE